MEISVESDLLLCISPDNRMMHVGPAAAVLPHVELSARAALDDEAGPDSARRPHPPRPRLEPLEVYDVTGRQIPPAELPTLATAAEQRQQRRPAGGSDPGGFDDPAGFVPVPHPRPADQHRLLDRINESLDFVQAYLTAHPEAGAQGPNIPPKTEVPRPTGSYPEVLAALSSELAPLDPKVQSNRGNWFHNLWHAATGTS